jgi:hypothetical protein
MPKDKRLFSYPGPLFNGDGSFFNGPNMIQAIEIFQNHPALATKMRKNYEQDI